MATNPTCVRFAMERVSLAQACCLDTLSCGTVAIKIVSVADCLGFSPRLTFALSRAVSPVYIIKYLSVSFFRAVFIGACSYTLGALSPSNQTVLSECSIWSRLYLTK